jgi:hypothetical protein
MVFFATVSVVVSCTYKGVVSDNELRCCNKPRPDVEKCNDLAWNQSLGGDDAKPHGGVANVNGQKARCHASLVLPSVILFAGRDALWGRFSTCSGLSIRLPPLNAPVTALENRHTVCALPLCGADCQSAAEWHSASAPAGHLTGRTYYVTPPRKSGTPEA